MHAHRPGLWPRAKGGFAASVVTDKSALVDLLVAISFSGLVTPLSWPPAPIVTIRGVHGTA